MEGSNCTGFVSKEPWYKSPPDVSDDPLSVEWGYLYAYPDGRFEFTLDETPSLEEITDSNTYKALVARQQIDNDESPSNS